MPEETVKTKIVIEQKVYVNDKILRWVNLNFTAENERKAAWETVFFIAAMYPEISDKLRGDLVEESYQEELDGNN